MSSEQSPVTSLRGVGETLAEKLAKLGVFTVQDLLFLLPQRYEDRTRVAPIGSLTLGERAVIEAEVQLTEVVFRRKRQMLCRIGDGSGFLTLRFFHFTATQQAGLTRGTRLRCFGEVRRGPLGLEMAHPEYRVLDESPSELPESLTPIYSSTEGLLQNRLRRLVELAFESLTGANSGPREWLPPQILQSLALPSLSEALHYLHWPPATASLEQLAGGKHPAQRRLAFEELLAHQLSLRFVRSEVRRDAAWSLPAGGALAARFLSSLPFALTQAQARVWREIEDDLRQPHPMLRLVQGDVGSGKTVVAALSALRAVEAGLQAVVMAPTELLAEQHARSFVNWLDPLGIRAVLLTGRLPSRARQQALADAASGAAQVVLGTHALFQEGVTFAKLGVAVIDEQHRFGVHQRMQLREKGGGKHGRYPHQLIMTATPIPRTLAMTAYADLDISVIDELPPGRTPVQTVVLPDSRRDEVVARIRQACLDGRQVYWVCPLIGESDELPFQAAEETAAQLKAALPQIPLGLIHGRLTPLQKDQVMQGFKAGKLKLLVATTVIEVGVDVPNASLMVIENTERMGLAQLHQLRGRVGRGQHASSCVLLYRAPLSPMARERLKVIRETNDGFVVARRDLELRGAGEILGTRQTGLLQLRVADLVRDADLLPQVQQAAELMLKEHPETLAPLMGRWMNQGGQYGKVA